MLGVLIEGTRVQLGPPGPEHLPIFVRWFADPDVTRYLLRRHPPSLRQEARWLERMAASRRDIVWAVTLDELQSVIGIAALHQIDWRQRHAWIEMMLGERSVWGKGYATETARLCTGYAFLELGLEKVLASVYADNLAARCMLERVGYRQCGHLRRQAFFGGRWHDEWVAELLVEQWRAAPAGPTRAPRSSRSDRGREAPAGPP